MLKGDLIKLTLRKYALIVGGSIIFGLLIQSFFLETFKIPTSIMSPSLLPGDIVFVRKWIWTHAPKRGDVIVYSPAFESGVYFIKRVIGLPGDTLQMKKGRVVVNGEILPLKWDDPHSKDSKKCGIETHPFGPLPICIEAPEAHERGDRQIPPGFAYVAGDFRSRDASSSAVGIIPFSSIIGRASYVWLSVTPPTNEKSLEMRKDRFFKKIH